MTTTIPVGRSPAGVAVGAGSVWVANSGDGTVTRIDPTTDKSIATIAVGGSPQAITSPTGERGSPSTRSRSRRAAARPVAARCGSISAADVDSMDPALAYDPLSWQLLYATCAKLLNYPDKAGLAGSQLVPEVAQSLPDPLAATARPTRSRSAPAFASRRPRTQPVTAQTFKDTIERTLNPAMQEPVAREFLADIVGARAYMAGKATAHRRGHRATETR